MQRGHRVVVLCTVIVLFSLERCSLEEFPTSCPRGFKEKLVPFVLVGKKELETPGSSLIPPSLISAVLLISSPQLGERRH